VSSRILRKFKPSYSRGTSGNEEIPGHNEKKKPGSDHDKSFLETEYKKESGRPAALNESKETTGLGLGVRIG